MYQKIDNCINCESEGNVKIIENDTWNFKSGPDNPSYQVSGIVCYHCTQCDEKFVTGDMDKHNHPKMVEAKRKAKKLLSGKEIGKIAETLDISAKELENILGWTPNTIARWKNGQRIQSPSSDALLLAIQANPGFIEILASRRGIRITGRKRGRPSKTQLKHPKAD